MTAQGRTAATTIAPEEVQKFSAIAAEWWDPFGKFKPLHKFNPVRLAYIRDVICAHFDRNRRGEKPLSDLRLLDVGCGGGLVAEPMSRLGAAVTAIDAAEDNVKTAMAHAAPVNLDIDYRTATVERLVDSNEPKFDVVLTLEVVEHVADVSLFLKSCAALVKPGGVLIMATINRTVKAFALAKIGAEYVLRWLPAGTHDPRKFVRPDEATAALTAGGLRITEETGVAYNPLLDVWRLGEDLSVNYMLTATKPKS